MKYFTNWSSNSRNYVNLLGLILSRAAAVCHATSYAAVFNAMHCGE